MTTAVGVHLAFALFALAIGISVLVQQKGTPRHKLLGRIWVGAMAIVAIGSFQIRELNPDGGLSIIHAISAFTILAVIYAIYSIRKGRRRAHMSAMIGSLAGVVVAGLFTLDPHRVVGSFLFGG